MAAAALAAAVGAVFWVPALDAARGFFPAPLDDVYIHFDFARSLAQGHPFEWLPGNGYSSGETSPLYAVVLAIGFLLGARGRLLGVWAAIVAVLAVASFVRSVQVLVRPCPRWLAGGVALLLLSVGIVDWSLFSGMEVATFAAAMGQSLLALARARAPIDARGGLTREASQWRLGAWGAVLVLLRPEAGVLVAVFAVVAARGAARRSGLAAVARSALPGLAVTALVLAMNRLATGTAQSAGAQLKLLSSNPYLSDVDRARAYVENLITFAIKGVRAELSAVRGLGVVVPGLALVALGPRDRRPIATACLGGAAFWILLVSFNNNAPFHNFRYYVPALLLVLVAASSGLATIARARRGGAIVAGALALVAVLVAGARIPAQAQHYARASGNIRDQQIEIAVKLARTMEPGARVLLGDAGAIPFVSERAALDALGLGGYRRMPFARAAVNGEAATVELIERLGPAERPAYFALYPNWFAVITSRFGVELDRVTLTDNLICAGPAKVFYRADWSALDTPDHGGVRDDASAILDELDVADVISEAEHAYVSPAPNGGWTTLDILADEHGRPRFDGGRTIPAGGSESFTVAKGRERANGKSQQVRIVVRVDEGTRGLRVHTPHGSAELHVATPGAPNGARAWREASATLDAVAPGDVITLEASSGEYRNYHVWITALAAVSALTR